MGSNFQGLSEERGTDHTTVPGDLKRRGGGRREEKIGSLTLPPPSPSPLFRGEFALGPKLVVKEPGMCLSCVPDDFINTLGIPTLKSSRFVAACSD